MPLQFILLWAVAPLVLGAVAVILLSVRRRAAQTTLTRTETWVISLIGSGAMLTVAGGVWGAVATAITGFSHNPLQIRQMPFWGGPVEAVADESAIAASGYETVWLDVLDVPAGARWLLFLEAALPSFAAVAIGVAVAWLSLTLLRERPFTRALPHAIGVAAIAVMVAGVGSQVAGSFGRALVVDYLGNANVTADDGAGSLAYFTLGLDLAPIGWAFGLALVAAAFQIGTRMQRETELLV